MNGEKVFTNVSKFEKEYGLKLRSGLTQLDLAKEAPDNAKIPKAFDFSKEWLLKYAYESKGFFRKATLKKEKEYTTRVVDYDEDNVVFLVTESETFNHRSVLDNLNIEEDGIIISTNKKPKDYEPLVCFCKGLISLEEDNTPIKAKRGEIAIVIPKEVMSVAISYLVVFKSDEKE